MGKRIIAQRRGSGSQRYRSPSFRFKGDAKHLKNELEAGTVTDIIHCSGHSSPLMQVQNDNNSYLLIAPEGIKVGDVIKTSERAAPTNGNILPLKSIPEGTLIYNVEAKPGDGGKFVRSGGTFAKVVLKTEDKIMVLLPSKKQKTFNPNCRAAIGSVAGGGRGDKPLLKAGKAHFKMRAKNKIWPKVSGGAMNAVDHPFGNKRSSRKSKAKPAPKNAPPGRKVGMIRPRQTGRRRGKK
ncbi:50S ribosomal protein L2 [Candidatus Woesearchaeota archaeon]|nr:50S ribosomal protein L2 [Candidatus Woesearchaeota archaeon]